MAKKEKIEEKVIISTRPLHGPIKVVLTISKGGGRGKEFVTIEGETKAEEKKVTKGVK